MKNGLVNFMRSISQALRSLSHITMLTLLVIICSSYKADATDTTVTNLDELLETMQSMSVDGGTISLAPGNYGILILDGRKDAWLHFGKPITLKPSDQQHQPVFKRILMSNVENLSLDHLTIDYEFSEGDNSLVRAVDIQESQNISVISCNFDGDNAKLTNTPSDNFGYGVGLWVGGSEKISIEGNLFYTWLRGAIFSNSSELSVVKNELRDLASDGFDFSAVKNVRIEQNYIHDFRRGPKSLSHPDMIQFWTLGTKSPTTDVVIDRNFLDLGEGVWTQSIFIRNELVDTGKAGVDMFYKNIRITNNVIRNAHLHGITVGETDGLEISSNTIVRAVRADIEGNVSIPFITLSKTSTNVTVKDNVVPRLGEAFKNVPAEWKVNSNITAQRDLPGRQDYYGHVFINALSNENVTLADLAFLPSSEAAQKNRGSSLNKFDTKPEKPSAFILNFRKSLSGDIQDFDASNIFGPQGPIVSKDIQVAWDFGDATSGKGIHTQHTYEKLGTYKVNAHIALPSGEIIEASRTIVVSVN
jgi:Right handed beta helix region/PKD domain